jgi:peptidoglycan hydrolase-like protein with peptidoglycan-binding domain
MEHYLHPSSLATNCIISAARKINPLHLILKERGDPAGHPLSIVLNFANSQFPMALFNAPQKKIEPLQRAAAVPTPASQEPEKVGPVKSPPKFGFTDTGPVQQKGLLNDVQLAAAKSFYTTNGSEFSASVIKEIQQRVGTSATGKMDDATVQAIAKYQQSVGAAADGKLGAKSLPKLLAHGLATDAAEEEFAADYLGINWSNLKTADERGKKMVELINKQLKAAGVPECDVKLDDLGADSGQFDFGPWTILVGNDFLGKAKLTRKELDDFANTVIHEARHAEQWFNMAQLQAGRGKTAREISTELGIPLRIAKEAVANPIKGDQGKASVANNWYQSVYGKGSDHRDQTLSKDGKYEDYRNLPEEHDAWRVGDEFDAKLKAERAKAKIKEEKKATVDKKKTKEKA